VQSFLVAGGLWQLMQLFASWDRLVGMGTGQSFLLTTSKLRVDGIEPRKDVSVLLLLGWC